MDLGIIVKRERKKGIVGFKGTDRRELELQNLTSLSLFSLQNPSILPAIAMPVFFEHSVVLACSPSNPIGLLVISTFKLVAF